MDEPERLSAEESHAMVAAPLSVEHSAGGTVRMTKAGIVGVGDTLEAALRDMAGESASSTRGRRGRRTCHE
jgi:hypothetical protein